MSYVILASGDRHYYGAEFKPRISDIAHSLAHLNRFNGHAGTYSVAEHCVRCAVQAKTNRFGALMHDAPEAYIGDIVSPLKSILGDSYRRLESRYHCAIDAHFGVDTTSAAVKEVDRRMLATEFYYLPLAAEPGEIPGEVYTDWANRGKFMGLWGWSPELAESLFLEACKQLRHGGQRLEL